MTIAVDWDIQQQNKQAKIPLLNLWMLGNFHTFVINFLQTFFSRINFFTKLFHEHCLECQAVWIQIGMAICPSCFGPSCLQRLSADYISFANKV